MRVEIVLGVVCPQYPGGFAAYASALCYVYAGAALSRVFLSSLSNIPSVLYIDIAFPQIMLLIGQHYIIHKATLLLANVCACACVCVCVHVYACVCICMFVCHI